MTKGYELLICFGINGNFESKNEIQSDLFKTEKEARGFFEKMYFDLENLQCEVYINYHDLDKDYHYEVARLR